MDNTLATQHLLTSCEELYFKNMLSQLNARIEEIMETHKLEGKWTISTDFKWLVKLEE